MVAAGVLPLADALRAMRERTLAVLRLQTTDPGRMVALSCGVERAAELLRDLPGYAAIAADNAPSACIVSADGLALEELLERAADAAVEATVLAVSHGYHSQLIAGACAPYREVLASLGFARPRFDVVSSITGASIRDVAPAEYPAQLERQYVEPVRLRPAVETLYASGVRLFVECGPKWPLTTFIGQILGTRSHVAQATLHPKVGEVEQLQRALACLFVHGAGTLRPLAGAERAPTTRAPSTRTGMSRSEGPSRDDVLELLRNMQALIGEFIARYDGAPAQGPHPSEGDATARATAARDASASAAVAPAAARVVAPAAARVVAPQPLATQAAAKAPSAAEVQALFVAKLVDKTGYPEEMLDPTLDLEADLGIDTVKQVAIMSETRAHFGLEVDPAFKLRDHNTIREVRRLAGRAARARRRSDGGAACARRRGAARGERGRRARRLRRQAGRQDRLSRGDARFRRSISRPISASTPSSRSRSCRRRAPTSGSRSIRRSSCATTARLRSSSPGWPRASTAARRPPPPSAASPPRTSARR